MITTEEYERTKILNETKNESKQELINKQNNLTVSEELSMSEKLSSISRKLCMPRRLSSKLSKLRNMLTSFSHKKKKQYDWNNLARESQRIPQSNWDTWLIMAGRGFGKTRTGAESIKLLIEQGYKRVCLLGRTIDEVKKIMINGNSGLLNIYPEGNKPKFLESKNIIKWKNGAVAEIHSSESYESLRGPQFDLAWVDELAKFSNVDQVWDQLMMTMRLGNPKTIITTTPRNLSLLDKLMKQENVFVTKGKTLENKENLSETFLKNVYGQYSSTNFGLQELDGEIVKEFEFWNQSMFVYESLDNLDIRMSEKIVISIDPAITSKDNSDETGIIVGMKLNNGKIYILEDCSGKWGVNQWPALCVDLYKKYKEKCRNVRIIAENNQGGDMIEQLIRSELRDVDFLSKRSYQSKKNRAAPISCLYQKNKVIHVNKFEKLEQQMIDFPSKKSPDRLDALCMSVNELQVSDSSSYSKIMFI
ncbi:terminase large subunit domain-containing protein [Candidatus Nesciobacter abundans]|uniref:DNA-packaging protein n=1 Tax=Candidatus Nesciobacter abundans TaxID=2601668 RepID=A0A5C0UI92_9PROT|nr:terminase family protein [Candidatus Nesciobacter abundans]QEK39112.1 DNA-packaging protein [Candidatus Nesciobacter abundans]